ncbi:DUF1835 domain-containing protein [uncultured Arcticibacterium sp.]|uniref:DUF1835 domain-containing protein n=1 Tax=uncultured Arcticibacterium sp. TaxID=2173042 RepID=UPI0030F5B54F
MSAVYHILNGDMLRWQIPKEIQGEIIICKEALVEGDVNAESLEMLFDKRAAYLGQYENSGIDYYSDVVSEFEKIINLPNNADVNLWFEFDLFCQVNLWFVSSLLKQQNIYLVLPQNESGFGTMNAEELKDALYKRRAVSRKNLSLLKEFWPAFQTNDLSQMEALAAQLRNQFSFLLTAVKANERRLNGDLEKSIKEILLNEENLDFQEAFKQFCIQEPSFGYADLQFKKIYDQLTQ